MARLFLAPGEIYGTVGGFSNTDAIGTNSNETVNAAADADLDLDPSFNRGGDILNIAGNAGWYNASLVGSSLRLTGDTDTPAEGASITIPVGTAGMTINFLDASRVLIFEDGAVLLGDQEIEGPSEDVEPGEPGIDDPLFDLEPGTAAGADVAHITGNISARVDITKNANQVIGLDLNGDGLIALNGVENVDPTDLDDDEKFEIWDAYVRNRTNYYDAEDNFLGSLLFDGTGFNGNGVDTNGNIVLGGLGADIIFGGIGNDFIVGGGVLPSLPESSGDPLLDFLKQIFGDFFDGEQDGLSGGRNADFFFAEFSTLSLADGDSLYIDAGTTADNTSAALAYGEQFEGDHDLCFSDYLVNASHDNDWFLAEVADDEEPIEVVLREGDAGFIRSADNVSEIYANIFDIENFDASGNLYGFVDDVDVALGEGGFVADWDGAFDEENVAIGSTAQLFIEGSEVGNIIVGGSDNDVILGEEGQDLLFGGNLKYHLNNPSTPGIVNDGIDELFGGEDDDDIVYEADSGIANGEEGADTLWLTSQSLGNGGAGVDSIKDWASNVVGTITTDSVLRFDLEADGLEDEDDENGFQTAGYGGADVDGTDDQTNFGGDGVNPADYRVDVDSFADVDATGMGRIDYFAAGGNDPELVFNNHQNHFGLGDVDLDLRGTMGDNHLYADEGDDVIEGRKGDDCLEGGGGTDDFYFSIDGDTIEDFETFGEDLGGECYTPDDVCSLEDLVRLAGIGEDIGEDFCTNFHGDGDGVDIIARKHDNDGDNFWDVADAAFLAEFGNGVFVEEVDEETSNDVILGRGTRYWDTDGDGLYDLAAFNVAEDFDEDPFPPVLVSQDFGVEEFTTGNPSFLTIDFGVTNFSDPNVLITNFSIKIGDEVFSVNAADLEDVQNADEIADIVNARFNTQDSSVTVESVGNTLIITDAEGRNMSDILAEGFIVSFALSNSEAEVFAQFSDQPPTIVGDRIIYKAYEDRSDNEGVDDDGITGSTVSLGTDAYAEDLVVGFSAEGTRLAEDQFYIIEFGNLTTEDIVTVTINGVEYQLQVGVDLVGNQIDDEDGVGDSQRDIQAAFVQRLTDFINSFGDDDTAAGSICAEYLGDEESIRISQRSYDGEETVFIHLPTVEIQNESGGEIGFAEVHNDSEHEVWLFGFDGRDNNLNDENVLFWGEEAIQRSHLITAKDAGGVLTGSEALVIDGGSDDLVGIPQNKAIDSELRDGGEFAEDQFEQGNIAVHGDDYLIGGKGLDTISGGTGDDRVEGSIGNDVLDGGNDLYAVRRVGDAAGQYDVEVLSAYEAHLADSDPNVIDIKLIGQVEQGGTNAYTEESTPLQPVTDSIYRAYFHDTLIYNQAILDEQLGNAAGTANVKITLDTFTGSGDKIVLTQGGAGSVVVDQDGDGSYADETNKQTFKNFENIRTVAGIKDATAGADGLGTNQGNDTLDLVALSNAAEVGVYYDLTDSSCAGEVNLIEDPDNNSKTANNEYRNVLAVDGVENVIFGDGEDLLKVDETEAAKNNFFDGGLAHGASGKDTIEYYNNFFEDSDIDSPEDFIAAAQLEPNLTFVVEASANTDKVIMTGGRLGEVVATDTLVSWEFVGLYQATGSSLIYDPNTGEKIGSDDVLDVTNVTAGTTINFFNGEVSTGGNFNSKGTVLVDFLDVDGDATGLTRFETFKTNGGNDLVLIAGGEEEMCCNVNFNDASEDLTFDTYMNYDIIDKDCERLSVADLRAISSNKASPNENDIPEVNNFGLYTFDLDGGDADRVDYSQSDDNIVAVILVDDDNTNYILVDADPGYPDDSESAFDEDECDRVDILIDVEEVVASEDVSILDFTALGQDTTTTFEFDLTDQVPSEDRLENNVRIGDGDNNEIDGLPTYIEYWDLNKNAAVPAFGPAAWNRIEGSDANEVVIYEGADDVIANPGLDHRFTEDELNLRGGDNEVHYNALNTSIVTEIAIEAFDSTDPLNSGQITAVNTFTDGTPGSFLPGKHTITSYATDNDCFPGTLRIQASQDQEDTVSFTTPVSLEFALTAELIIVSTPTAEDTVTLTGYEILQDNGATDDCYDFTNYAAVRDGGLTLADAPGTGDHDTAIIHNDYVNTDPGDGTPDIEDIEADFPGFDFDVLDLSTVTSTKLTGASGDASGPNDELVIGELNGAGPFVVDEFETLIVSQATVAKHGSTFVIDSVAHTITVGAETINLDGEWEHILSFNGQLGNDIDNPCADSCVDNVTTGVTVTTVGDEGVGVAGGDGNDSITGSGAGNDTLYGGLGADTLNGNRAGAVLVQNIAGVGTTGGTEAGSGGVNNLTSIITDLFADATPEVGDPFDYPDNSDADAIGATWGAISLATWQAALDDSGLTTTEANSLTSVTFNTTTNDLTFVFASTPGGSTIDAADLLAASDLGDTGNATLNATETATGYTDAVDTFLYCDAAESTAASQDTIVNFSIDSGTGSIDDRIDLSLIDANNNPNDGDQAFSGLVVSNTDQGSFGALTTAASGAFGGADVFVGRVGTDGYVIVDTNQSGAYNAGDMVILLDEVGSVAGITGGENFIF